LRATVRSTCWAKKCYLPAPELDRLLQLADLFLLAIVLILPARSRPGFCRTVRIIVANVFGRAVGVFVYLDDPVDRSVQETPVV
jgi:hypothetical protein